MQATSLCQTWMIFDSKGNFIQLNFCLNLVIHIFSQLNMNCNINKISLFAYKYYLTDFKYFDRYDKKHHKNCSNYVLFFISPKIFSIGGHKIVVLIKINESQFDSNYVGSFNNIFVVPSKLNVGWLIDNVFPLDYLDNNADEKV